MEQLKYIYTWGGYVCNQIDVVKIPFLFIKPSALMVPREGLSIDVEISSNVLWNTTLQDDMIIVDPESGENDVIQKLIVKEYPRDRFGRYRETLIKYATFDNFVEKLLFVKQEGASVFLDPFTSISIGIDSVDLQKNINLLSNQIIKTDSSIERSSLDKVLYSIRALVWENSDNAILQCDDKWISVNIKDLSFEILSSTEMIHIKNDISIIYSTIDNELFFIDKNKDDKWNLNDDLLSLNIDRSKVSHILFTKRKINEEIKGKMNESSPLSSLLNNVIEGRTNASNIKYSLSEGSLDMLLENEYFLDNRQVEKNNVPLSKDPGRHDAFNFYIPFQLSFLNTDVKVGDYRYSEIDADGIIGRFLIQISDRIVEDHMEYNKEYSNEYY